MSGFSATEVSSLSFDFTPWGGPKGVIPEPSEDAIRVFFDAVQEQREALAENPDDPDATKTDGVLEAVSAMGDGEPSVAVLKALPGRVRIAFLRWLFQELTNPKA